MYFFSFPSLPPPHTVPEVIEFPRSLISWIYSNIYLFIFDRGEAGYDRAKILEAISNNVSYLSTIVHQLPHMIWLDRWYRIALSGYTTSTPVID